MSVYDVEWEKCEYRTEQNRTARKKATPTKDCLSKPVIKRESMVSLLLWPWVAAAVCGSNFYGWLSCVGLVPTLEHFKAIRLVPLLIPRWIVCVCLSVCEDDERQVEGSEWEEGRLRSLESFFSRITHSICVYVVSQRSISTQLHFFFLFYSQLLVLPFLHCITLSF